jgi:hypothetical protein
MPSANRQRAPLQQLAATGRTSRHQNCHVSVLSLRRHAGLRLEETTWPRAGAREPEQKMLCSRGRLCHRIRRARVYGSPQDLDLSEGNGRRGRQPAHCGGGRRAHRHQEGRWSIGSSATADAPTVSDWIGISLWRSTIPQRSPEAGRRCATPQPAHPGGAAGSPRARSGATSRAARCASTFAAAVGAKLV